MGGGDPTPVTFSKVEDSPATLKLHETVQNLGQEMMKSIVLNNGQVDMLNLVTTVQVMSLHLELMTGLLVENSNGKYTSDSLRELLTARLEQHLAEMKETATKPRIAMGAMPSPPNPTPRGPGMNGRRR